MQTISQVRNNFEAEPFEAKHLRRHIQRRDFFEAGLYPGEASPMPESLRLDIFEAELVEVLYSEGELFRRNILRRICDEEQFGGAIF